MAPTRGRLRRRYCTWESRGVMGQTLLFLEILRLSGIYQDWPVSSHVRPGGSAHMGEMFL